MTREERLSAVVEDYLDDAQDLRAQKVALLELIDTNRQQLRAAVKAGHATEDQAVIIAEWYPFKGRGGAVEDLEDDAETVDAVEEVEA